MNTETSLGHEMLVDNICFKLPFSLPCKGRGLGNETTDKTGETYGVQIEIYISQVFPPCLFHIVPYSQVNLCWILNKMNEGLLVFTSARVQESNRLSCTGLLMEYSGKKYSTLYSFQLKLLVLVNITDWNKDIVLHIGR